MKSSIIYRSFALSALLLFAQSLICQPIHEIRAAWLTTVLNLDWPSKKAVTKTDTYRQKQELCQQLDLLKAANFNTILFQTRLRGDLLYPSTIEPFSEILTGTAGQTPSYDPLAFAISECHKRGLECHAWIVTMPLGSDRQVNALGRSSITKKQPSICTKYQGEWFLEPGNPQTANYLVSIVNEIVKKYDVDGIHLDYIRYPDRPAQFPDQALFAKFGNNLSIAQWRRNNITHIVRQLYHAIKKEKPWVKLSSAPIGRHDNTLLFPNRGWNAYGSVYQNAQAWLKEGIHDVLFPMMYFKDKSFFSYALDWKEHSYGRLIAPGLGTYQIDYAQQSWSRADLERQIQASRIYQLAGQAHFRVKFMLNNSKGIYDELISNTYAFPAKIPPMSWMKEATTPSMPDQFISYQSTNELNFNWKCTTDHTLFNFYCSTTYPVDINNPANLVATRLNRHQIDYPINPMNTSLYFVVTALDRFGNESLESKTIHYSAPIPRNECCSWSNQKLVIKESGYFTDVVITDLAGRSLFHSPFRTTLETPMLQKGSYRVLLVSLNNKVKSEILIVR